MPDDVSIVGFDDIPEAMYLWPPLTTIRQDFDEVGRRCIEQDRRGAAARPALQSVVPPTLVVRGITAGVRR